MKGSKSSRPPRSTFCFGASPLAFRLLRLPGGYDDGGAKLVASAQQEQYPAVAPEETFCRVAD